MNWISGRSNSHADGGRPRRRRLGAGRRRQPFAAIETANSSTFHAKLEMAAVVGAIAWAGRSPDIAPHLLSPHSRRRRRRRRKSHFPMIDLYQTRFSLIRCVSSSALTNHPLMKNPFFLDSSGCIWTRGLIEQFRL